jgi:SprT-like family
MIKYTPKQRARQDTELHRTFEAFNDRFFAGEISVMTRVVFQKGIFNPKDKEPADAFYAPKTQQIKIDDSLRGRNRQWQVVLLHEMAHAWLYQVKEYVGWGEHAGHGRTFQGVICRLIQIGAYDGLL